MNAATKVKLAVMFHDTGADPDKGYSHPHIVENYKALKTYSGDLVDDYEILVKTLQKIVEVGSCECVGMASAALEAVDE